MRGYAAPSLKSDGLPTHIYAIHDDSDLSNRAYVGMSVNPSRRLDDHLREARKGLRTHKACWLRSVIDRGGRPAIVVLEVVPPGGDYQEAERFWIASMRGMGMALTNDTDGGHGIRGYRAPPEVIQKQANARRGKKMPREAVERRAAWRRGRKARPESVAKTAAGNRGKKRTPSQRAALSALRWGRGVAAGRFRGVRLKAGRYDARIDNLYLGRFDTAEEAAVAFDIAARREWGPGAALNFPFPGELSARPGIEPQEWIGLPSVTLRQPGATRATNTSGLTGASFCRENGKWYAAIKIDGKSKNLGHYDTPEEAHAVYKAAKAEAKGGQ